MILKTFDLNEALDQEIVNEKLTSKKFLKYEKVQDFLFSKSVLKLSFIRVISIYYTLLSCLDKQS